MAAAFAVPWQIGVGVNQAHRSSASPGWKVELHRAPRTQVVEVDREVRDDKTADAVVRPAPVAHLGEDRHGGRLLRDDHAGREQPVLEGMGYQCPETEREECEDQAEQHKKAADDQRRVSAHFGRPSPDPSERIAGDDRGSPQSEEYHRRLDQEPEAALVAVGLKELRRDPGEMDALDPLISSPR